MLIGMNNAPISPVDYIYDVTTADFENTVLKASMDRPILLISGHRGAFRVNSLFQCWKNCCCL